MKADSRNVNEREISSLKDHIGYWMRMVSNQVSWSFAKKLEETGVTVAEWVVLREIFGSEGTTSPSTVADLTGLTRGAISKLMTRLMEKDLISRKEAREDRRFQDIKLTSKAKALVPRLSAIADENDEAFFSALSKPERKQLKELLIKLASRHQMNTAPIE